jgi:hypothetical protein
LGTTKVIFIGILIYASLVFISVPYVFLANAMTATGATVKYEGSVIRKFISGAKSYSYVLIIFDKKTRSEIELSVPRSEYEQVPLGSNYQRCLILGGFDMPFRWRYGSEPTPCMHLGN